MPDPLERAEEAARVRHPEQGVRAALRNRAQDLVQQRAGERRTLDDDLPAGLHPDTGVDEQLCVLAIAGVGHRVIIRRTYCFVK